jgi:anti-sigma factor RsiW
MSRFEDGILVAYVDGELSEALAREVEAASERDVELRRRIALLRLSGSVAREAFRASREEILPRHPAQKSVHTHRSPAKRFHALRQLALAVAASVLIAIAGFGATMMWRGKSVEANFADSLLDEVAEYHAVFARETEHQVEVKADRLDEIEAWFSERLRRRLRVPDLTERGLAFRGARLLVVEKQLVAELVYSSGDDPNRPLALCIVSHPSEGIPLKMKEHDGINLALWGDDSFVYVLAGWLDSPTLAVLAAELKPMQGGI